MLLNTVGYYEVLLVIQRQNLDHAIRKINENQDEISGNLLLRIPMNLPYGHDDPEYKRAFGAIVVDGQVYHFVKQKLYKDTLYVVCLKDPESTKVRNAISDYTRAFGDQHPKSDGPHKLLVTALAKFYMLWTDASQINETGWIRTLQYLPVQDLYRFSSITNIFHPPC